MPTVRYQIRNEYGLADPELYRAADKDDPEALLEGVAMAGLVGVLRQLGDLAEFAAEIFHNLHEEATSTAARGHGLLLRVQQLEAEFPSIEKAFLVQTNHLQSAYNDGIDWHANLRMDQNLVTQGDMPRFVLDSYEECRGPPRLFMLDKFDVAGSGACLKRYSDPSFFKVEFSSARWGNKHRKIRKKASRWKNGETAATFMSPLINSNLQTENSDQGSAKVLARRVKPKSRNLLGSDITNKKSYMEHLLEVHSPGRVWQKNYINHLPEIVKSIDSSGLPPEAREIVIDTIVDSPIVRATYPTESPTRKEVLYFPTNELDNHKIKSVEKSESTPEKRILPGKTESFGGYMPDKHEKRSSTLMEAGQQKPLTDEEFSTETGFDCDVPGYMSVEAEKSHVVPMEITHEKYLASFESNPEDEYGEHRSDDISSDLENYVDALNTMESEVETDPESRAKSEKGFSKMETRLVDYGICEQQDLPAQPSGSDSVGELTTSKERNGMLEHFPGSFKSGNLAETKQHVEDVSGFCVPDNEDNIVKESPGEMLYELPGSEVRACESSVDLPPDGTCNTKVSDATSIKSIVGDGSFGSLVMCFTSGHVDILPKESDEACSVTSLHEDNTGYAEGTHVVSEQLDCKIEGLPDFTTDPNNAFGESIPLTETGDLSLQGEYVIQGIDPAECVQEQISEEATIDMSDHLSAAKDKSDFEEIPAEHIGESMLDLTANPEEQVESVKEVEDCLDGSVTPNNLESLPEISIDDVQNSQEVVEDLDGALPHTDEIGFTEPPMKSRVFGDDLLPLSDVPGSSPMEDGEPLFFEDMKDVRGKTIPEEVPSGHTEDPVELNVDLGALEDPMEHDNRTCTLENMSPSDPALSLENDQLTMQPDVLLIGVMKIVAGVEDACTEYMEERKSLLPKIVPLELDHFSDVEDPQESHEANSEVASTMPSRKETVLDDMQLQLNTSAEDAGKSNILMPNTKSSQLENSSLKEEPQGSRDDDSPEHFLLGTSNAMFAADKQLQNEGLVLMVKSGTEEPKESHNVTLIEHLPLYSASEILLNDMPLLNECGHMVTSDESDPRECPIAETSEHFSQDSNHGDFSDDLQFQNNEHGHLLMDTLGRSSGSASSDLHKESVLLDKHTECTVYDDSSDEHVIVEADDNNQRIYSVYSGKSSGFGIRPQENCLHHDAFLDQHDKEVNESSYVNNFILPSQNESRPTCTTAGLCSNLPVLYSSDPGDAKLLDSLSSTILLQPNTDRENLVCSLENGVSIPKEGNSPSSHFVEDGSEPLVASSHQDSCRLESMHTQFQITCINDINNDQSISKDNADQPSKREPHVIVSNGEIDEPDISLLKVEVHEKVEDEAFVASRCSSEFLVASLMSSFSAAGLAPITGSTKDISKSGMQEASLASSSQILSEIGLQEATMARSRQDLSDASLQESETILQETNIASSSHATAENDLQETVTSWPGEPTSSSQSQEVVETPPLPPLPPMEWRLGKLQFGSLASNVDFIRPPTVANPSMKLISGDDKLSQGPPTIVDEMVQPETCFASLARVGNENFHRGSLTLEEETTQPSRLSKLPPVGDERRHHKSLMLETEMTNHLNSFIAVSHQEDRKYSNGCGVSASELEDGTTQYPQLSEGEIQVMRPQLGHLLPSLELERSQYEALSVARGAILPPKPLFIGPSTEEWKHECDYEVYGGENVQHLNFSAPVVARGPNMPPYGFLYSMEHNPSTIYDFTISTMEGEKPKWTYRSIRDRPRDPLIEAVAAHDKSTLRKVSELDRPSARPQADERDSLLEQIRNKAFNLKPANGPKPNIKGAPPTNLKVAAILEKANAIRQACAGSDEDDEDGDNWSDS